MLAVLAVLAVLALLEADIKTSWGLDKGMHPH